MTVLLNSLGADQATVALTPAELDTMIGALLDSANRQPELVSAAPQARRLISLAAKLCRVRARGIATT